MISTDELTYDQRHLVGHAANMGGWLTETYFDMYGDRHSQIVYELVDRFGLFRYEPNQIGSRGIYRLTADGQALAEQVTR